MNVESIKIIDNKRILLTKEEWDYYNNLCRAYDTDFQKGEELFKDHFETNKAGVIIFVKPPYKKYSSLEVYTFLVSLMINQHLRLMHKQVDSLVKEATEKFLEVEQRVEKAASLLETKVAKEN